MEHFPSLLCALGPTTFVLPAAASLGSRLTATGEPFPAAEGGAELDRDGALGLPSGFMLLVTPHPPRLSRCWEPPSNAGTPAPPEGHLGPRQLWGSLASRTSTSWVAVHSAPPHPKPARALLPPSVIEAAGGAGARVKSQRSAGG